VRRAIGVVMFLTGLLLAAIVGFGLWWAQQYGLAYSVKGGLILVSIPFAGLLLLGGGAYLLRRPRNSN
jgi:hypothetical protein